MADSLTMRRFWSAAVFCRFGLTAASKRFRSINLKRRRTGALHSAFTLLELLVVIAVIAVLAAMSLAVSGKMRTAAQGAYCANSLRQLGVAAALYLNDNERTFFRYSQPQAEGGTLWYFGYEAGGGAEGERDLDQTRAPLYPYIQQTSGVQVCPSFPYESALWKPKFKGASWGYGFNIALSGVRETTIERSSQILLFGDCAQINTFQPPASPKNPLFEEFYYFDSTSKTVHFRHNGRANMLFLDGHVDSMKLYPKTADSRLPSANIGRITAVGSTEFLK